MRIVHINVRLNEGGAARVALDLHSRALSAGIESQFFYGYGAGAKRSDDELNVVGAVHLSSRPQVMLNYATHKLSGIEIFPPCGKKAERLVQAIRGADVVHLHAIHSYFLPFSWFSDVLLEAKHIVWTCHDFWPITGRCAFLEGCEVWRKGCGKCPSGLNYPPAHLDLSAYAFKNKRKNIERHLDRMVFTAPSKFVSKQFQEAFPRAKVVTIYNGIDAELEREISLNINAKILLNNGVTKVLVMANDLSDPTKIDRIMINDVMMLPGVELHTIGRNSPFKHERVVNHGEVQRRSDLVKIMQHMNALLFTSLKDTFGLVMIEAMICGVPVLALPSDAANEVLGMVGYETMQREEILNILDISKNGNDGLSALKRQLDKERLKIYSGDAMFDAYRMLYQSYMN